MKKVVLSLAVAALALGANAQKKESKNSGGTHFGIGVKVGLPIGDASDVSNVVFGGEVSVEHNFSDNFAGVGSVGYSVFNLKSEFKDFGFKAPAYIPIMVGARYYAAESFFVGAKLGYAVSAVSGGVGGFSYEPQIGYNAEKFQIAAGYNGISVTGGSISNVAATFTYKF